MAFKDLTVNELREIAEFFLVEVDGAKETPSKREVLTALASGEEPVSWEQYEEIYLPAIAKNAPPEVAVVEDRPVVIQEPKDLDVVLKMERANGRFDIRGYTFTKEHPYRPTTTEDADWIVMNVEGFRRATTQEVADYYS